MTVRVLALASGLTTVEGHRLGLTGFTQSAGTVTGRSGIYPASGAAALSTVSAMVCAIAPFNAWIDGTNSSTQGGYSFCSDAAVNITFDAGNASTTRTDRIIARVKDNVYDGSGSTTGEVAYLKGNTTTGAATALPANSLLLYEVAVPAGASAGSGGINFGTQTTNKIVYTTASGGLVPIGSATDRTAIASPFTGMMILRTDQGWIERYDGSAWRVISQIAVSNSSGLSAVTSPFTGQIAFVISENRVYRYTGSAWTGLTPYKDSVTLGADAASITFSNIPAGLKNVKFDVTARSTSGTDLMMRIGGDTASVYSYHLRYATNDGGITSFSSPSAGTATIVGFIPADGAGWSGITGTLFGWNAPHSAFLSGHSSGSHFRIGANNTWHVMNFNYTGLSRSSITFYPNTGNLVSGSQITIEGWDG